jgi:hypothetical protein
MTGDVVQTVNRGDVRMIQRREHLRLAFEVRNPHGIRRKGVWKNLDGDVAGARLGADYKPCANVECGLTNAEIVNDEWQNAECKLCRMMKVLRTFRTDSRIS